MKSLIALSLLLVMCATGCTGNNSVGSQGANSNNARPTTPPTVSSDNPTACRLKVGDAPALEGLRLGMTSSEVLANFPESKNDPDVKSNLAKPPSRFGVSELLIRPNRYLPKPEANKVGAVSQISVTLLDGRVSNLNVGYNGPPYSHVDDFVKSFVAGKTLPDVSEWQAYVGLDNQLKILTCTDFEVRVFAGGEGGNLNYVQLQDLEADKKLKERRKKAREQASPTPAK